MSASSASDSSIQIGGPKEVMHAGRVGKWQAVHADELERVPFSDDADKEVGSGQDGPIGAQEVSPPAMIDPPMEEVAIAEPPVAVASPIVPMSVEPAGNVEKPKLELQRRQQLEHRLKSNPTDLNSFLELGRIYRAENRPIEARRVLNQAMQIFPDEPELIWELEEATLSRSLQQLREVSDLANRLKTAETERELARCQQDWAMRRIEVCQARLARDPSMMNLRIALGEAKYDAGDFADAMEVLDLALDNDEFSPSANLIRGKCQLALGKDLDAMVSLRACALRRAVIAPPRTRVIALRLLCETADRLGLTLTLANYRSHLQLAEQELAKKSPQGA